ncbi:hypothetical protein N9A25_00445 [bacterium]|nr:hypothetical protein [bacterium]
MENELELIASNAPEWLKPTAAMAVAIVEQYHAGGVEQEEMMDIVVRMCDELDRIPAANKDLDTKSSFITALYSEAGII